MKSNIDVSIIIVSYNTKDITRNCLNSIFAKTKDIAYEVIVSDNGSNDGSVEMIKTEFSQVKLIENNVNLGFGSANNKALKEAKGKYIFYLNSDTVLLNNAGKIFFDYYENNNTNQIGAIGCNLLDQNHKIIHSYSSFPVYKKEIIKLIKQNIIITLNTVFPFLKVLKHKKTTNEDKIHNIEVDYITGADLFCLNNEYAIFDEKYFLYFEETDLQFKMSKNNLKRIIIDGPEIIHLEGKSNENKKRTIYRYISFSMQEILISRLIWFKKNNYKKYYFNILYLLSIIYLSHFVFLSKTKKSRYRIRQIKRLVA